MLITTIFCISCRVLFPVDLSCDSDLAQDEAIVEFALLAENLNQVFDHAILYYLCLKRNFSKLFFLLLRLILSSVFETLLVAADFIITDLHDKLDIVLHDHVKEIADCILFWRTCSDEKLFLKTRVNP